MDTNGNLPPVAGGDYPGRILTGDFSPALQQQVAAAIERFAAFDATENPALTYISAWREKQNIIWYEFVSRRFRRLIGAVPAEMADKFRESVIDRRVYRYLEDTDGIRKEVLGKAELHGTRRLQRQKAASAGRIEAVYKVCLDGGQIVWLKDQALVAVHPADRTYLSLGTLTPVTKEMELEDRCEQLIDRLKRAITKIRTLSGLLPICASCKKIRDDKGYWKEVEDYISQYSDVAFSHSVCPECARRLYPELYGKEGGGGDLESIGNDIADIDVFLKNT